jgi:N-hydroxyarylamine O-acetyltransferase
MRLHDYLRRIGVEEGLPATAETLRRIHVAHREAFLFENVSIQSGGAISVELDDVERKFIDQGRGGYCFEHNTLFAAALRDLGFAPLALLGRVRRGPPERWARTHMVLRVPVDGDDWLADVGFGGVGLLEPILLRDGTVSEQAGLTYRLRREAGLWVLSMRDPTHTPFYHQDSRSAEAFALHDGVPISDLYEFSEDPQTAGDVAVANHFTSTHPDSIFRRTLTIQRSGRDRRLILRGETLTCYENGTAIDEPIARDQLRRVARELFGVDLPERLLSDAEQEP